MKRQKNEKFNPIAKTPQTPNYPAKGILGKLLKTQKYPPNFPGILDKLLKKRKIQNPPQLPKP